LHHSYQMLFDIRWLPDSYKIDAVAIALIAVLILSQLAELFNVYKLVKMLSASLCVCLSV